MEGLLGSTAELKRMDLLMAVTNWGMKRKRNVLEGADEERFSAEHQQKGQGVQEKATVASQTSLTSTRDSEEAQADICLKSDCSPTLSCYCSDSV